MDWVQGSWTTSGLGPWWTAVVRPRVRQCACQSASRRRCGSPAVAAMGGGGRGGRSGAEGALTGDGATVKRPGDGDEGARWGRALARERRNGGRCGVRRDEVRSGCLL
jgi:hypothetical protein